MDTEVNYAVVGGFVITLLIAIIFCVVWLSAGITLSHYSLYKVYMNESVSGLNIDSPVEFNGVDMGNVISMDIDHNNPHLVELLLRIKAGTPITNGTRATLNSRGITGTTYIALQDKGADLSPIQIKEGESYPIIPTSPSLFLRLDTALSELAKNMQLIAADVRTVLSPENQKALHQTLLNMRSITDNLATNNQALGAMIQNSANAMQIFNQQTLPAANQAMSNISILTRNLSDLSVELKQNPGLLIRGRTESTAGPGE